MAFGVTDLLWILAGISYKTGEGAVKALSQESSREMSDFVQNYILENTDATLEKAIADDVANPQKYEAVWEKIEKHHRENPIIGWCRRYKDSSILYSPQFSSDIPHAFSLDDIGKNRLYFWSHASGKRAYKNEMESVFYDCQEIAITLLMWIHGKETRSSARKNAFMIYDRIKNQPKFPLVY
ncbi:MAG: hypothetical protein NC489_40230 [Ruminococcus flavefaciens]|nr:hypothetical protein [Ruminococcus flavefaciens]